MLSEDVINFLDQHDMWQEPYCDVRSLVPNMNDDEAYLYQFELMKRRVISGDTIIGYKAAGTSRSAQKLLGTNASSLIIGTLLRSILLKEGGTYRVRPGDTYVEAEIGVILGKDLSGPGITYLEALSAIDGYVPAMEISPWSPAVVEKQRSRPHLLATQKTTGGIIIGHAKTHPSIDIRYEGAVVEVNGRIVATGTGAEVLGDPVNVVVEMANHLAKYGLSLKAGMLLMTGSAAEPLPINVASGNARITFSRIGSISVQFEE